MFSNQSYCRQKQFFLRVFALKEKFRCLIKQDCERKNAIRELSLSIFEKFNGFNIVRLEFDRKLRQKMSLIDIIYKPVKKETENIECFFSTRINMAYRSTFNKNEKIRHGTAFQCYFCSNYCRRKDKFDRHIKNCTGRLSYVYNFNTQNLLTFEENLKFKHDIPLTAYIDFETTAPTDDCLNPENKKMAAVSYVIIFAFHPHLQIDCVIIERSFGHSNLQLCSLNYLTSEQLKFKDINLLKQLRDCALSVASKRNKLVISEMFCTELKFASDCLMKWFNSKFKIGNMQLSNKVKRNYEVKNPINWEIDCCCTCHFHLKSIRLRLMRQKGKCLTLIL